MRGSVAVQAVNEPAHHGRDFHWTAYRYEGQQVLERRLLPELHQTEYPRSYNIELTEMSYLLAVEKPLEVDTA